MPYNEDRLGENEVLLENPVEGLAVFDVRALVRKRDGERMSVQIDKNAAQRVLSGLSGEEWISARLGLEILDDVTGYAYRATPLMRSEIEGVYVVRAESVREAGLREVDLDRFNEAIALSSFLEVVNFSFSNGRWSCVCVASPDLFTPVASVVIEVGTPGPALVKD
jgi:hypothetical protein